MKRVIVFIVPQKAYARLQRDSPTSAFYFDSLYVREHVRKRGIGTRLLLHAMNIIGEYPELDIRKISHVAQRIASKAGYQIVSDSTRYRGCSLWQNAKTFRNPGPQFEPLNERSLRFSKKIVTIFHFGWTRRG